MFTFKSSKDWLLAVALFSVFASVNAETGVTATEILIGQSAALTGPAAELGQQMQAGAQAYFKAVNTQGGVFSRRIRMVTLDDGYEPERAAANTRQLIEKDKVFALFGYVGTPTSNAALPLFTAAKVPFFAPFTGAESMRRPVNRNIFNVRTSYMAETQAIVDHLAAAKNIAVLYQNDAYGQAGLLGVRQALAKKQLQPAAVATVDRNSTDVAKAVDELASVKPQAVVIITTYTSAAAFIKEMKKKSPTTAFWNVSFVGSRSLSDELGEAGRGVGVSQVVPFPWDRTTELTEQHYKSLGDGMSFTTLEGYLAARVFVEGLRRAGKDLTREGLITALETAGRIDVGGFSVQYSPDNREGSNRVELTLISTGGRFIR